ncbi:hypothetical protein [Sulfurisphaera tokodaii]|nr:hypothetical protein [Sulfurisphaera tokodaii]
MNITKIILKVIKGRIEGIVIVIWSGFSYKGLMTLIFDINS